MSIDKLTRYEPSEDGMFLNNFSGEYVEYCEVKALFESLAAPTVQAPVQTAAEIRAAALEEAALLCDEKYDARIKSGHPREASSAIRLAEAIRALAGQQVAAQRREEEKSGAGEVALLDELQQTVSDFRKATFEFARGMDPDDHARMLSAQMRIFEIANSLARQQPAAPAVTDEQAEPVMIQAQETGDERESAHWFEIHSSEVQMYCDEGYKIRRLYAAAPACKWPTCQPEHVQKEVADQAYLELYSGEQAAPAVVKRISHARMNDLAQEAGFNLNMNDELVVPYPGHDARKYLHAFAKLISAQPAAPAVTDSDLVTLTRNQLENHRARIIAETVEKFAAPAVTDAARDVLLLQEFEEWLNDRQMCNVSLVFHEIVAKYRTALRTKSKE